ncbi:TPA: hypothetical protein N0F65_003591 [Lagenidium giganteum]|uniref:PiggyBac transposable element-derived protein domain-containing protein n=1 Tax=Lagenidium giganteum TaxID=4803 RepID=A0AAV2Z4H8_9STRA|nr:TPA: hypothetical protein N0F65_003591 [Lagenidium giganteum]
MMYPHRGKLADHWAQTAQGAVPAGTFGQYMLRNRFQHVCQNLLFSDNLDDRAKTDRAWKVRPVVDTLQKTFRAMLPSRSRYNPTRVYMRDKPHKWGAKRFMTCCAV